MSKGDNRDYTRVRLSSYYGTITGVGGGLVYLRFRVQVLRLKAQGPESSRTRQTCASRARDLGGSLKAPCCGLTGWSLEGQGDLVSRLITPITHIVSPFIPIINLLTKSP